MASLDSVSIAILLGAMLVMAGILSSLLALRFGAPLLLVFLIIGMLAGDSGLGGLQFDDVRSTYLVGSVALALILFDGGLRTRFQAIRGKSFWSRKARTEPLPRPRPSPAIGSRTFPRTRRAALTWRRSKAGSAPTSPR